MQNRHVSGVSFPLQIFLALSLLYVPFWFLLTLALMIYKAVQWPFPNVESIVMEFICVALLWILQWQGGELGKKGNLTEQPAYIGASAVFILLTSGGAVYYMRFQTYVTRLDFGFSATLLAINIVCIFWMGVALHSLSNSNRPQAPRRKSQSQPSTAPATLPAQGAKPVVATVPQTGSAAHTPTAASVSPSEAPANGGSMPPEEEMKPKKEKEHKSKKDKKSKKEKHGASDSVEREPEVAAVPEATAAPVDEDEDGNRALLDRRESAILL